jgi:hypothetical protein
MVRAKWLRSRTKRSNDVEGKAVEVTACTGEEAVEGVLHRRRYDLGVGNVEACSVSGRGGGSGIEDLKLRATGESLTVTNKMA